MDCWTKIGITTLMIILISEPADGNTTNMDINCSKPIHGIPCPDNKVCQDNCDEAEICPCKHGYSMTYTKLSHKNVTLCDDISECVTEHKCKDNAQCRNTAGGYYCSCFGGYRKGNLTHFCPSDNEKENSCTDIDECKEIPGICGPNSVCENKLGSYSCHCLSNYMNISNSCTAKKKCYRFICGRKGICISTKDSINCSCQEGYRAVSMGFEYAQCNVKCSTKAFQPVCNANECNLDEFEKMFTPSCSGQFNLTLDMLLKKLGHLFTDILRYEKEERLQKSGILLNTVEKTVQNVAPLLKNKSSCTNYTYINVEVINSSSSDSEILLKGANSSVKLDTKTALGNYNTTVIGILEYSNISHLLSDANLMNDSKELKVNLVSPVVSVFIGNSDTSNLSHPVELHINFTDEVKVEKTHCAFWSTNQSAWSTSGCETQQRFAHSIVCTCTHLTSFAVLMALEDIESWTLDLITRIGLSISIICLVLAIITFCFCRSLRGTGNTRKSRNTIHTFLSISLLLANCIFLFGIEATFNKPLCGIVAGLLHALYLAAFCWMSLEGLELYLMLVTVFNTQLKTRYLLAVGYGVPAVIVMISAAVYHKGYEIDKYCWLSRKKGFNWSFMGPVCIIILINCGIFVLTVWKLTEKMSTISPEQGKFKKIRTLTITSIAQLCILGCCWAFGFLMFNSKQIFFAYAFTVCNTLQGFQIFVLHCLMNKKVRAEYRSWLCAIAHFKAPIYSEFSNSSNANTHSRVKASKESGL